MRKDLEKIIYECLEEVYRHTSPSVDLQWIIDSGEGKKEGWFENYVISELTFESIIERWIEKYKLKGSDLQSFKVNMYLGPSPRFTPKTPPPSLDSLIPEE